MRRTAQPRTVARQPLIKKAAAPVKRKAGRKAENNYSGIVDIKGKIAASELIQVTAQKGAIHEIENTSETTNNLKVCFISDEVTVESITHSTTSKIEWLFGSKDSSIGSSPANPIPVTLLPSSTDILCTQRRNTTGDNQGYYVELIGPTSLSSNSFSFWSEGNNGPELEGVATYMESPANTDAQYYFERGATDIIRVDIYDGKEVTIKQNLDEENHIATIIATYVEDTTEKSYEKEILYPFRGQGTTDDTKQVYIQSPSKYDADNYYTYAYTNPVVFNVKPAITVAEPIVTGSNVLEEGETSPKWVPSAVLIKEDTQFDNAIAPSIVGKDIIVERYNEADYYVKDGTVYKETAGTVWIIDTLVIFTTNGAVTGDRYNIKHDTTQNMSSVPDLKFAEPSVIVKAGVETGNAYGKLVCGDFDATGCSSIVVEGSDDTNTQEGVVDCTKFIVGKSSA